MNQENPKSQSQSPAKTPARVLIVDDHPIVREGLSALIEMEGDMVVCATAENADQALEQVPRLTPDVVVADLSLMGKPGLELIKDLRQLYPAMPILVLSIHDENLWAERALRAGAQGYVMKSQATENVMEALRRVLAGGIWLSSQMNSLILGRLTRGQPAPSGTVLTCLSDRELEVFHMIGRGQSIKEIAQQLHLSAKTVEVHREHIKEKLSLKSSAELLRFAVTHGLEAGGA